MHTHTLQEHLAEVELFQEEAREELRRVTHQAEHQHTLTPSHLPQLLTRGEGLGITVPELALLRVVSFRERERERIHSQFFSTLACKPMCIL